jgi:hypothetical protein
MLYYKLGELPAELPESLEVPRSRDVTKMVTLVTDENGIEETIEREETFTEVFTEVVSPPYSDDDITLAGYKLAPEKPEYDPVWQKCVWVQNEWILSSSAAAVEREDAWINILKSRQELLDSTDYIVDEYNNMPEEDVQAWKDYRQALRDITQYHTGEIDDYLDVIVFEEPSHYHSYRLGMTQAEYEGEME